nr:hypothetical protein [uncultured Roseococcus sp.]
MNATTFRAALAPSAAATTAHPDADLIAACREHAKAHDALCGTPDNSPEEAAYVAAIDKITGVIPETFGGIIALTDAIMLEASEVDGELTVDSNVAADWCFQIVQALHAGRRQARAAENVHG